MSSDNLPLIVSTKLNRPLTARDLVPRTRLLKRLHNGRHRPLTLVTAPAGYGKSTLLSSWLETLVEQPTAWLSLEDSDNDLVVFLTYFVAAVQTMFPQTGQETTALLSLNENAPARIILATLINELNTIKEDYVLVLDDYHVLLASEIQRFMIDLMIHAPRTMHLALTSRTDPRLPIVKLRARDQVTEVRAQDLRFSMAEAKDFLTKSLGDSLDDTLVTRIYDRAEGWVTGLRLAVLSMPQFDNPEQYSEALSTETPFVTEYLMSEALLAQGERVQQWLLKAAILERFCPDLCEAVCSTDEGELSGLNGNSFVEYLISHNLFVIPLDAQQTWYRFHHLFGQFLRHETEQHYSALEVRTLHSKAANWLAKDQYVEESLHHFLAAGDYECAADVVEQNTRSLLDEDRWHTLEIWMAQLPDHIIQKRPALLLAKAWGAFHRFALHAIPPILETVEFILDDDKNLQPLWGEIDFFWGHHWYWLGERERSLTRLSEALEKIPKTHHLARGEAELFWGIAMQVAGRKAEAVKQLNDWLYYGQALHPGRQTKLMGSLIFIPLLSGELASAAGMAQQLRDVAIELNNTYIKAWTSYMLGHVYFCRNDMENAVLHFSEAVENRYILHSAAAVDSMAGLAFAFQDLNHPDKALETLADLERFTWETNNPAYIAKARSCQAHLSIMQGDLVNANRQLQAIDLETDAGIMFYFLETPRLTACRVLLASARESALSEVDRKLDVFWQQEKNNFNVLKMVEILLLQTLSYQKQARFADASLTLNDAVLLAYKGGYVRPFIETGPSLLELLSQLPPGDNTASFVQTLQQALQNERAPASQQSTLQPLPAAMYEELTTREREVLDLLASEMSNQEIAHELTISLHTVKRHTGNLYRKLDVNNRRQAVAKARRAGLLPINQVP